MVSNMIDAGWDSWVPQTMNDEQTLFEAYGDKIAIPLRAIPYGEGASEEEMRVAARAYVSKITAKPGFKTWFSMYDGALLQPAYREELYIQSRKAFSEL